LRRGVAGFRNHAGDERSSSRRVCAQSHEFLPKTLLAGRIARRSGGGQLFIRLMWTTDALRLTTRHLNLAHATCPRSPAATNGVIVCGTPSRRPALQTHQANL
jgi:hypothetical protein